MSLSEFIKMGDHGFYVWSCYLVTLVIFVSLYVSVNLKHKKLLGQINRRNKREAMLQQKEQLAENNQTDLGEKL